jgi:anaerobic selenocysteine-containing dehydrogenase
MPGRRSDLSAIFDLAGRLGLGEHFFGGDVAAAWRHQLEPSGLTLEQRHEHPIGLRADAATHHRKYAGIDAKTGCPRGFATPSRKMELYSTRFAGAGYDPLPRHSEPTESPIHAPDSGGGYPLVLTSFRLLQFVDEQHRNIPRLRKEVSEPIVEIRPETAAGLGVLDGEWVNVETVLGKIRLMTTMIRSTRRSSARRTAGGRHAASWDCRDMIRWRRREPTSTSSSLTRILTRSALRCRIAHVCVASRNVSL